MYEETHRGEARKRPVVPGMKTMIEIPHDRHGSVIFAAPGLEIVSVASTNLNGVEILIVALTGCTVTSVYKPPSIHFHFSSPVNFYSKPLSVVIGDFNSHSQTWGYQGVTME